jgi:hypothetical protein
MGSCLHIDEAIIRAIAGKPASKPRDGDTYRNRIDLGYASFAEADIGEREMSLFGKRSDVVGPKAPRHYKIGMKNSSRRNVSRE